MTEEIYTQLLELYVQDLENENTGLHLQVKAYEILKDYKPPAIVSPYKDPTWPHQYPIWCVTEELKKFDWEAAVKKLNKPGN